LDPDPNRRDCRLGLDIDVTYLEALHCLQFSSNFLPTSHAPPSQPELLASNFMKSLVPHITSLPANLPREFVLSLTERGSWQGSAGLHLNLGLLHQIKGLDASLALRMRYVPQPHFFATGECYHDCGINPLTA
jgi:hypothetical protein